MSDVMTNEEDIKRLVYLITQCDKDIKHWKDRADRADLGYGPRRYGSLNAQTARHYQSRAEEWRIDLLEKLQVLGGKYDGPPTEEYTFDVTGDIKPGHPTTLRLSQMHIPRCTHTVKAIDVVEARILVIKEHRERCIKK